MSDNKAVALPARNEGKYVQEKVAYFSVTTCLMLGLTISVPIAPEARLTLFDAIALLLILGKWRAAFNLFKPAIGFLAVSAIAMAISAYVNGSAIVALVGREYQGIALLIEIMGYSIIITRAGNRACAALVFGVAAGICFHYFYPVDQRVAEEPIKFLVGIPLGVSLLALYALMQPRGGVSTLIIIGLMLAYSLFCFLVGSRSVGGVFFVSSLITAGIGVVRIPRNYRMIAPLVITISVFLGYMLTEVYTMLALNGVFGIRAANIAAFQSSYGSILLGGRPEVIINLSGIKDAPFLGVGIINYPSIYLYEMIRLSVYSQDTVLELENVLYHSALFGTAFESGTIAALFWFYMLYMTLLAVPLLKMVSLGQRAFIAPLLLISIWHILYSPPIPYNRFVMGIGLAFAILIYAEWKQQLGSEPNQHLEG
ncbi:hypothetical protein [Sphingomonas sp. 1185]|uniref:hypothetical protein n=1 Tax=Sphingomonas sp. 1185 TaxID=3156411 RepID=UPI0033941992